MECGGDSAVGTSTSPLSAQMSDVQLVMSWCYPMAHQVAISLRHKGVNFTIIEENALNRNLKTRHVNPLYKIVPILIHMRRLISDSLIIMEYIEEVYSNDSPHLLPSDPFERSAARYWSSYVQTKVTLTL